MRNFQQRVIASPLYARTRSWEPQLGWFSTDSQTSEKVSSLNKSDGRDIEVSKDSPSEKLKLSRRKRRGGGLWGRGREIVPFGLNGKEWDLNFDVFCTWIIIQVGPIDWSSCKFFCGGDRYWEIGTHTHEGQPNFDNWILDNSVLFGLVRGNLFQMSSGSFRQLS